MDESANFEAIEPGERALYQHVFRVLSASIDPEERGAELLPEIAASATELARRLDPGEIKVRVSNREGERDGSTLVEILTRDQPFLVDTFRMGLRRLGLREIQVLHPLLAVERDTSGRISSVGKDAVEGTRECYLYAEVTRVFDDDARIQIGEELARVFRQLSAVVSDHMRMVRALRQHTADIEFSGRRIDGGQARVQKLMSFLSWLADDNFIFFGYRSYDVAYDGTDWKVNADARSGLGLMREVENSRFAEMISGDDLPPIIRSRLPDGRLVFFDKSRLESKIHRNGRLDCVSIKRLDEDGRVIGFGRFIGLLTHKAVRTRGSEIPRLRERRDEVLAHIGAEPGSHTYKAAIEAYDSLPIEFLFPFEVEDIARAVTRTVEAAEHGNVGVLVVPDPLNRSFFVSVSLPRRDYEETLRAELEELLRNRYRATYIDHRSSFFDDSVALIHFFCSCAEDVELDVLSELEREVGLRVAGWQDQFEAALLKLFPKETAYRLAGLYAPAFPEEYRSATPATDAVQDVASLERLRSGQAAVDLGLYDDRQSDVEGSRRLKVFQNKRPYLTDLVPLLDNFGLRAVDASLTEVSLAEEGSRWIVTFRIEEFVEPGEPVGDLELFLLDGLRTALAGTVENDTLNHLILGVGLEWRQVDLIRAYLAYARQIGIAPERVLLTDVLMRYPDATRALIELFRSRFSREAQEDAEAAALQTLARSRDPIPTVDEDKIFGMLKNLICSTVRTNFYVTLSGCAHAISFKLDSVKVDGLPSPRPHAEIFVHSSQMMGVHLRGGSIARGGIRWSERLRDFRTEILGLMKTQKVKNGLIIPAGAKGGFVLKRRIDDPARARVEADLQYTNFMKALLQLTDNVEGDSVVRPRGVVCHDGDDPYLVVAADKGTAHLSDVANEVAIEAGFWLGDAFASGGSEGYDHKALAITARGAWVSVKRHFLELGTDIETEPFTIAGIGDMSGDVFGNGLLLAKQGRLLAAFNHRHILLDPDPDPERSWRERQRLFEARLDWAGYDASCLSRGGGVYERAAKSIELSREAREMLDVTELQLTGEQLIQAILRMRVDLLWSGGIGTYVKASHEIHAAVGDRANESVRVDGAEIRARVVAEGGNLGFTQLARIEYAMGGGCINTDAVDNAGGVDLSDHEVNFKILLAGVSEKELSRAQRNAVLRSCVDQAIESVLDNIEAQNRSLSKDLSRIAVNADRAVEAAVFLARSAGLDWKLEFLPERHELRSRIGPNGQSVGYTRPELAILLGYTKMLAKRALVESDLPDHPSFATLLRNYFPEGLRSRFEREIPRFRLRREVTATRLANHVIDNAGVTMVPEMVRATGASVAGVIGAHYTVDCLLEADLIREAIDRSVVSEAVRLKAALRVEEAVRSGTRSWIGLERRVLLEADEACLWADLVRDLRAALSDSLGEAERGRFDHSVEELVCDGFERELAARVALLPALGQALGVAALALHLDPPLTEVLRFHARVGESTGISWFLSLLPGFQHGDGWERAAAESLYIEALGIQRTLTERLISEGGEQALAGFRESRADRLRQIMETAYQVELNETGTLPPLTLVAQQIRRLL